MTRPNRRGRRHLGKTDTLDAEAAAASVLARTATANPKRRSGIVEAIRVLRLTRASAVKARAQAESQLRNLILTAPAELREKLEPLSRRGRIDRCARLRAGSGGQVALDATVIALRSLAQRIRGLDRDIRELDRRLRELLRHAAPRLLAEAGVGPESAAKLLIIAGDNADRIRSDAALAALWGASPIEASTGKTRRHRLNRRRRPQRQQRALDDREQPHAPPPRNPRLRRPPRQRRPLPQRNPPLPHAPPRPPPPPAPARRPSRSERLPLVIGATTR